MHGNQKNVKLEKGQSNSTVKPRRGWISIQFDFLLHCSYAQRNYIYTLIGGPTVGKRIVVDLKKNLVESNPVFHFSTHFDTTEVSYKTNVLMKIFW